MKRIEFISPVAAIRGNMSGTQRLVYPLHDNKAFEGPDGSVNYARNYRPSYIGTKRAADGRCSFQTKRKSANHLTTKAKNAMANLGGVGAIYSALVRDKSAQVYIDAQLCYAAAVANGYEGTFRKFMYSYIKPALDAKNANIDITIGAASVSIDNPWGKFTGSLNLPISNAIRVKFWENLVENGGTFTVNGQKGAYITTDPVFSTVIVSNYNFLNLGLNQPGFDEVYVVLGGNYSDDFLQLNGAYITTGMLAEKDAHYTTTNVSPE